MRVILIGIRKGLEIDGGHESGVEVESGGVAK